MAAETITPTCEVTGLPLTILPKGLRESGVLFYMPPLGIMENHHDKHPNLDPVLTGLDGRVLRHSRVIKADPVSHANYHRYFTGPLLPKTQKEFFRSIVFSTAGVIPPRAIDCSSQHPEIVDLTSEEIDIYRKYSLVQPEGHALGEAGRHYIDETGRYFARYSFENHLTGMDTHRIEEFMSPKTSSERRLALGNEFIKLSIENAVGELEPLHENLKQLGLIARKRPKKSLSAVILDFFETKYFPSYHVDLRARICKQLGNNALQTGVATV